MAGATPQLPVRDANMSAAAAVRPKVLTLLMVVQRGRLLLGQKKRGFGAGPAVLATLPNAS